MIANTLIQNNWEHVMKNQSSIYSAGIRFRNIGIAILSIFIFYYTLPFYLNVKSFDDLLLIANVGIFLSIFSIVLSLFIISNLIIAGIDLMNFSNNKVEIQSSDSDTSSSYEKTDTANAFFYRNENIINMAQLILVFIIGFVFHDELDELFYEQGDNGFLMFILLYSLFISILSYKNINFLYSINLSLSSFIYFIVRYILSIVVFMAFGLAIAVLEPSLEPMVGAFDTVEAMSYFVPLLLIVRIGINLKSYLSKQ